MKVFCGYVKKERWHIGTYLGFMGIFVIIFSLYGVKTEALSYAVFLSTLWLLFFWTMDFMRYRKKHKELLELEGKTKTQWEMLPEPENLVDEDYQWMVRELLDTINEQKTEYLTEQQDMMDYYSLWAHQIKTPISAMRILLQSQEESQDTEYSRALKAELFKIEQYVDMVLTYLRMDSMSADMVFQWHSLEELAKQAVRKYSQLFILQKIKLEIDIDDRKVLTDKKWLVFVIGQILSNALKYTKQGKISIYTQNQALVIEDTGIGIEAEELPRVFERGFTGYNGRRDGKSTGIGLYLCKRVMDKLSHGIAIDSVAGKGTKVYLILGRKEMTVE